MLKGLRVRLSPKQEAYFKIAVWTCLMVWMLFFFVFSVATAQYFASLAPTLFGPHTWGLIMTWILPIWVVFTALLIIVLIARYANRKLRG